MSIKAELSTVLSHIRVDPCSSVVKAPDDQTYCGLPFKAGGRDRTGLDCAGLARLWLHEQLGLDLTLPEGASAENVDAEELIHPIYKSGELVRGDVVFFRERKTNSVRHVAIYLGNRRYLHILRGCESRIDTGTELLRRIGFEVAGAVSPDQAATLCRALTDPKLGNAAALVLVILSIVLSLAAGFIMGRPKVPVNRNQTGRYGFDNLATQTNATLPLPDILGQVIVAGNSPYQSMIDKSQTVTDATAQKTNYVVVLGSGPVSTFDANGILTTINGIGYTDTYFKFKNTPAQTELEAVTGTIAGTANTPSFTFYDGAHGITVPVDVRAQFDRDFPIYGFSGCSYMVFRLINSTKFSGFNLNTHLNGRLTRTFNSSGFITTAVTGETLTGDGSSVRFKLANFDLLDVTSVTVGGTTYTAMDASHQSGNVYSANLTKGYLEFLTAPANATSIVVNYDYYVRAWSNNPANHLVYLLTETGRGKGFPASKLDWQSFSDLATYCSTNVTWINGNGSTTAPRYTCNYAIDVRKTIQEHLAEVLNACYGYLFLSNGKFYAKARKSETSIMDFTTGNIIADSFVAEKIDRSQTANRVHVFFRDTATYGVEDEIIRDDNSDQRNRAQKTGDNGVVELSLHLPAIDNLPQAERYAEQVLRENVAINWTCQFVTNIKGLALQPGDVITVTHPAKPLWNQKLFRIEELNYDEQDQLTLKCSEYFDGAYI